MPSHGTGTVRQGRGGGPATCPTAAVPHSACVPPRHSLPACSIWASRFLALARLEWQLADGPGC